MYCQKCRTPLKLDNSLEDLNPAAFDLLVGEYRLSCLLLLGKADAFKAQPLSITLGTFLHLDRHIHKRESHVTTAPPNMKDRRLIDGV